mmetsp:Transcript_28950/g.58744  ORF Transcript_28950/g.58744 Transcript_28950/m.58744 type:complete len:229 (-) Transcript_28950:175-861(-)
MMGASFCGSLSFFLLFFAARMQEEAPPRVCFGETRSPCTCPRFCSSDLEPDSELLLSPHRISVNTCRGLSDPSTMRCIAFTAAVIFIRLPSITSAWSLGKPPPCLTTTTRKQQSTPPPRSLTQAATASDDDTSTNDSFSKQAQQAEARQSSDDSSDTSIVNVDGEVQPKAVYGVSYIGGDPCGSKYNDDPFDAAANSDSNSKPGMPDDAKERIRLLAEQLKNKNKGKE